MLTLLGEVCACSLTEPPRDQVTYFRRAEPMAPRIRSEAHGCEPQTHERVDGLFDKRDRSVWVCLSRGKPRGHPARTDAPGEDASMQYRCMREGGPITRDIGRAASAPRVPGDEDVRVIDNETRVRAHPLDASQGVSEIRRHLSWVIAHLPSEQTRRAAARVRSDYREASSLGERLKGEDEILTRLASPVQDDQERRGL